MPLRLPARPVEEAPVLGMHQAPLGMGLPLGSQPGPLGTAGGLRTEAGYLDTLGAGRAAGLGPSGIQRDRMVVGTGGRRCVKMAL